MKAKIYSAAKATTLRKGLTKKEVWEYYSKMFPVDNEAIYSGTTFIYGGYRLEEKVKSIRGNNTITIGDRFKAVTYHQTIIYVTIEEWNPFDSFSYVEQTWSKENNELTVGHKTDFNLIDHPEGTLLEIIRRERGNLKTGFFDFIFGRNRDGASWASGRLGHIIGGNFCKLKNKESIQMGEFIIERDDSLRKGS